MDEELKQLLETMRQENAAAHEETRRHAEVLVEGLRQETSAQFADVRRDMADTRQHAEGLAAENRRHAEKLAEDNRRRIEGIAEGLQHNLNGVADGVLGNTQELRRIEKKFDRIVQNHDARLTRLEAAGQRTPS